MVSRFISLPHVLRRSLAQLNMPARLLHKSSVLLSKKKLDGLGNVDRQFCAQEQEAGHPTMNGPAKSKEAKAQSIVDDAQVERKVPGTAHIKTPVQLRGVKIVMPQKNVTVEDHNMMVQDTKPRTTSRYLRFRENYNLPNVSDSAEPNVTHSSREWDAPLYRLSEEAEKKFQEYEMNRKAAAIVEKAAETLCTELKETVVGNGHSKNMKVGDEPTPSIVVNFVTRGDIAKAAERNKSAATSSRSFLESDFDAAAIVDETYDDPFEALFKEAGLGRGDLHSKEFGRAALIPKDVIGWSSSDLSNGTWSHIKTMEENLFKMNNEGTSTSTDPMEDPFKTMYKEDLGTHALCERNPLDSSCTDAYMKVNSENHLSGVEEPKDQGNSLVVRSRSPSCELSAEVVEGAILRDSLDSTSNDEIAFFSESRLPRMGKTFLEYTYEEDVFNYINDSDSYEELSTKMPKARFTTTVTAEDVHEANNGLEFKNNGTIIKSSSLKEPTMNAVVKAATGENVIQNIKTHEQSDRVVIGIGVTSDGHSTETIRESIGSALSHNGVAHNGSNPTRLEVEVDVQSTSASKNQDPVIISTKKTIGKRAGAGLENKTNTADEDGKMESQNVSKDKDTKIQSSDY